MNQPQAASYTYEYMHHTITADFKTIFLKLTYTNVVCRYGKEIPIKKLYVNIYAEVYTYLFRFRFFYTAL